MFLFFNFYVLFVCCVYKHPSKVAILSGFTIFQVQNYPFFSLEFLFFHGKKNRQFSNARRKSALSIVNLTCFGEQVNFSTSLGDIVFVYLLKVTTLRALTRDLQLSVLLNVANCHCRILWGGGAFSRWLSACSVRNFQ